MLLKGSTNVNSIFSKNYLTVLFFLLYSLLLLFFSSGFSPLYDFNIWSDVNVYYTIGKGIIYSKIPYTDLFDHKGPIIFFIYVLGYLLSPNSFLGMYILQSLFLSISLYSIFLISNIFLDRKLSILSSFIFPFFLFHFSSIGGSAEEFILPMMLIGLYLLIKYFRSRDQDHSPFIFFIHGILIGLVFFIKANLIIFWFFPICFILFIQFRKDSLLFFKNLVALILGYLLIFCFVLFYFYLNDSLSDFFDAYFFLNLKYSSMPYISLKYLILGTLRNSYIIFSINNISFLIIFWGIFCFSGLSIFLNKAGRIAILLSILSTCFVIFAVPVIMEYYYIILCLFIPLGIISIFFFIRHFKILYNKYVFLSLIIVAYLLNIYSFNYLKSLSNLSDGDIFATDKRTIYQFSDIIMNSNDKTLLCLGLDIGVDVFSKAQIIPSVKYFFTPNVVIDKGTNIYRSQKDYITNTKINFIIVHDNYRYKSFFESEINKFYRPISSINNYTLYKKK